MSQSSIEWTELTWNPVTGCTKVSAGCKFCYAEVMSRRLKAMGLEKYKEAFQVRMHPGSLIEPYRWKGAKLVFVNSMSDLFHPDVSDSFIYDVFYVMSQNTQHRFQILTKRPDRVQAMNKKLHWPVNIWMGTSIEDERVLYRIDALKTIDAKVKFISCEPLIGPIRSLNLTGIDWVIVGGESGRKPRPMKKEWVIEIRDICKLYNTAFFFKQWGGTNKKKAGRELDGIIYDEMPLEANYL